MPKNCTDCENENLLKLADEKIKNDRLEKYNKLLQEALDIKEELNKVLREEIDELKNKLRCLNSL